MEDKTRYVLYVVILGLVLSGLGSIFSETLAADPANRVPIATFFLVCICLFLILFNYESSKTPDQLEQTLTKRVSDSWVADLVQIKKHLPHGSLFPVRFSFCADGVRFPSKLRSVSRNAVAEPTISTAFQMSGGSLLVLGEAGSGKTVSLLQLTGELIENAKKNPSAPIPIFLSLASWRKSESLEAWLMTELRKRYDVAEDVSRSWILGKRLVFLLDDLKETDDTHIEAINGFLTAVGTQGIVISAEGVRSSVKLNLNGAIRLQELSEGLTRQFLSQLHTEQTATDEIVRISRSPLILAIISFAPHAMFEFLRGCGKSLPAKKNVVNAYVNHQIEKVVPKLNPPYASSKLRKWLSWLAGSSRTFSVFAIEDLQPDWLVNRWHIRWYVLLSRFAGALTVMALGVALMYLSDVMGHLIGSYAYSFHFINVQAALVRWFLITVCIGSLTLAAVDYYRLVVSPARKSSDSISGKSHSTISDLLPNSLAWTNLIIYFFVFLFFAIVFRLDFTPAIHGAAAYGVAFSLTYWNRDRERTLETDLTTAHKLVWSAAHVPNGLLWGFATGYWFGMLFVLYEVNVGSRARLILVVPSIIAFIFGARLFRAKQTDNRERRGIINSRFEAGVLSATVTSVVTLFLIWGFRFIGPQVVLVDGQAATRGLKILGLFCLLGTIVGLIVRGLNKISIVEERTRYQGLKTSLRTTILLWLSVGVPIVLVLWSYTTHVMRKQGTFKDSLFFGMMLGMLFGFSYAGLDLIYRVVLRTILRVRGDVPFYYSTVLDDAANLGILRKIGHAYVFYHDLVRDYFNTHAASVPQVATSVVKSQHPYLDVSQEGDFSGSAS